LPPPEPGSRAARIFKALSRFAGVEPAVKPPAATPAEGADFLGARAAAPAGEGAAAPAAPFRAEPARVLAVDFQNDPDQFRAAMKAVIDEVGVGSERGATALVAIVAKLKPGDSATVRQVPPDVFYVRISARSGEGYTGFVSRHIRAVTKTTGGREERVVDIFNGERYVDITATVQAVQAQAGKDFNFFRAMADLFATGRLPEATGLEDRTRSRLYNDLALAAYLMFGIEVMRHPPARSAAILSLFLGTRLPSADGELTPAHVILGDPVYRERFMGVMGRYFGIGADSIDLFDSPQANGLMKAVFEAQRNRIDLESGGLFPSSMVQFMDHDQQIRPFTEGKLTDPAHLRFVEEILRRYDRLFEMALERAVPDLIDAQVLPAADRDRAVAEILKGRLAGDPLVFDAFVARVLAEMMRLIMGGKGTR
jgi:hypothetical protein